MTGPETFAEVLGLARLRGASLAEVDAAAALQHRVDRKYLLPVLSARCLVAALAPTHHVLDLGGRRTTGYRSTYFDTAGLGAWHAHVQRRRRRWKVRTRLYVEDGLCRVEVKTKDGRGATVKHARTLAAREYGLIGAGAAAFVDDVLGGAGVPVRAGLLAPAGRSATSARPSPTWRPAAGSPSTAGSPATAAGRPPRSTRASSWSRPRAVPGRAPPTGC